MTTVSIEPGPFVVTETTEGAPIQVEMTETGSDAAISWSVDAETR